MSKYDLITIVGPTASGKTAFACRLAKEFNTEIISGDSRQVYRQMDIGTGKDLSDYVVDGQQIPYHLIDIHEAGYKYNIYEFQHDFHRVYQSLKSDDKLPILSGGSGLYIESVIRGYNLIDVPENKKLREQLKHRNLDELTQILTSYKTLHNNTDVDTVQRAIRAIEIEEYKKQNKADHNQYPPLNSLTIGIDIDRNLRRNRISKRLHDRLQEGMIEEVQHLLNKGIAPQDLIYYGLEYKFVTQYILKELTYQDMVTQLEIAIHQFAKRQMTWFRGMQKRGTPILWIDYNLPFDHKLQIVKEAMNK